METVVKLLAIFALCGSTSVIVNCAKICVTKDADTVRYRVCESESKGPCTDGDSCSDIRHYNSDKYPLAALSKKVFYAQGFTGEIDRKWTPKRNAFASVYLVDNNFGNVTRNMFLNLGNAKDLVLKRNEISNLDACAFCGLHKLWRLFLTNSRVKELPKFGDVTLQVMTLTDNRIKVIRDHTFGQCKRLKHLALYRNEIEALEPCAFCGASRLEELQLGGNQLTSLPRGAFKDLVQLRALYLSQNQLTDITDDLFSANLHLEVIDLSHNKISTVQAYAFSGILRLKSLKLNSNNLAVLRGGVFKGVTSIDYLNIAGNEQMSLADDVIARLNSVVDGQIELGKHRMYCRHKDRLLKAKLYNVVYDGDKHIRCNDEENARLRRGVNSRGSATTTSTEDYGNYFEDD